MCQTITVRNMRLKKRFTAGLSGRKGQERDENDGQVMLMGLGSGNQGKPCGKKECEDAKYCGKFGKSGKSLLN